MKQTRTCTYIGIKAVMTDKQKKIIEQMLIDRGIFSKNFKEKLKKKS